MPLSQLERTQQRRRLLRAAASAPVVFTLPTGAVLAATSLSCADKSAERFLSEGAPGVTTSPDSWMRFQVPALKIKPQGSGSHVSGFELNGVYYQPNADGTVAEITNTNGTPTPIAGSNYLLLVDYSTYSSTYSSTSSAHLYVYPGQTPVSNPIAGASCWSSLTGVLLTTNVIN